MGFLLIGNTFLDNLTCSSLDLDGRGTNLNTDLSDNFYAILSNRTVILIGFSANSITENCIRVAGPLRLTINSADCKTPLTTKALKPPFVTLKVFEFIGPFNGGQRHGRGIYLLLSSLFFFEAPFLH
jgi:hypothetical protein